MGNATSCFKILPALRNISPEVGTTYDPLKKAAGVTLTNGNMTAERTGGANWQNVQSVTGKSTGKYYWEWRLDALNGENNNEPGISDSTFDLNTYPGETPISIGWQSSNGRRYLNWGGGFSNPVYGSPWYTIGDVVGMAVDFDANIGWYSLNGAWQVSGNPAAGTNGFGLPGGVTWYINGGLYSSPMQHTLRTSVSEFSYTMPSGFSIWD